jgi:hypothetical protein
MWGTTVYILYGSSYHSFSQTQTPVKYVQLNSKTNMQSSGADQPSHRAVDLFTLCKQKPVIPSFFKLCKERISKAFIALKII